MMTRTVKIGGGLVLLGCLVVAGIVWQRPADSLPRQFLAKLTGIRRAPDETGAPTYHVEIVRGQTDTIRFSRESYEKLQIRTVDVKPAPPPEPLRLPGSLQFDPDRLIKVHSRFTGELIRIGDARAEGSQRRLRYGDRVEKDDLLAVVWSKEIGEKKSELVDAFSKLEADRRTLKALESAAKGAVAELRIVEAKRNVDADWIALSKAERTLRSWRLTESEIQAVYQEAEDVRKGETNPSNDKSWAELEIRAPISGLIVQKDFNEGAMIDPDDDLFKIADVTQLRVVASVYEEDLPMLRQLPAGHRNWLVDLKSDPHDPPVPGTFDLIGTVIDPKVHTGVVLGWIDNRQTNHAAGQFITATVELTADPTLVVIPAVALIEEGDASYVFVETNAERLEFTRRKVQVTRRGRQTVFVCGDQAAADRGCNGQSLTVGERILTTMALELSAELEAAKARSPEDP
ncbi:MAG: efflux RND transporter periplasmic adaptor subunit [Planctomycetes bacterium]|nr:efflux RND transporter periplasmic adaptor subunit [Planctomycetota bacterium]